MSDSDLHIVLAQLNFIVGDVAYNTDKIIRAIKAAQGADLIIFPELSITSYPPDDLLFRPALYEQVSQSLAQIKQHSHGIHVVVGHPSIVSGQRFNSASVIHNGETLLCYHKQHLPNYGVFDEKRYFNVGTSPAIFQVKEHHVALTICEDIWSTEPCQQASQHGADLLLNINASPFSINKLKQREDLLRSQAKNFGLDIVYVNLIGGQDELVFDGDSMVVNKQGDIVFRAPQFTEDCFNFCLTTKLSPLPIIASNSFASIYQALILGVRDYVYKNHFKRVVLGLSGGIDSAMTLCIAVDSLSAEQVHVLIMPSQYTSEISVAYAIEQAQMLKVRYDVLTIEDTMTSLLHILSPCLQNGTLDQTAENLQARCRGVMLMAVSNYYDALLLTTSNKSESSVGYTTLYGDMAGGFSPLKDIYKTKLYELANWYNKKFQCIPQHVIERPPTAELRSDQLDTDTLPPYPILDNILEQYIENSRSAQEIIQTGVDEAVVYQVIQMINRNEYKRHQAAPGIKITEYAFGRNRRYPITSGYQEL